MMMRAFLLAIGLTTAWAHAAAPLYATRGAIQGATQGTCAGFPRVELKVPAGHCVALVADASSGLRFPRRILEIAPGRYWIVDMGSWEPNRGRLLEMLLKDGQAKFTTLIDKLDRPLGLIKGPDGKIYIGEAQRIWRTPTTGALQTEVVVDRLPNDGAHPLKELAFDHEKRLYINVGSFSDACRGDKGEQPAPCPESNVVRPRGAVYEVPLTGPDLKPQAVVPFASGLRNSVALAFVPGPNVLLQGENSIDYSDEREPPEELNLLQFGKHYGWPYCVGDRKPARGYEGRHDCARSQPPAMLWPAHAAPLQMIVPSAGPYAKQLLVAWHGYRAGGHRVVAYTLDAKGLPTGAPRELIAGWTAQKGVRPLGAPTGIAVDSEGRLLVVEDRNKTVLMLVSPSSTDQRK